jgi:CheY-like chemotaxis protein
MRILFLDDNEDRHNVFRRNTIGIPSDRPYDAQEAIELLSDESTQYDIIFLDHDLNHETENQLNDNEEDGRFVAKHLATLGRYKETPVILHSLNQNGRLRMFDILSGAGFSNIVLMPFAWEYLSVDGEGNLEIDPNR